MEKILASVIDAHGGLKRWKKFKKVLATIRSGGILFNLVNIPEDTTPRQVTTWLHEEHSSVRPLGAPHRFADFTPNRIAVRPDEGKTLLERTGTPDELHDHMKEGIWDSLDRTLFTGYGTWTYLTTPFLMTLPGFKITEIEPWQEKNEKWYGLRVEFPPNILSHSRVQHFYFGGDFLLRRHDYFVDVAGEFYAAQYVHDIAEVEGIKVPTKRRAYKRGEDGNPIIDQLMVWIDLSEIKFI